MTRGGVEYSGDSNIEAKGNTAEEVAQMVFAFVAGAKAFTEGMDKSDEVRLLRLRTRKNEIVIVPGRVLVTNEQDVYVTDMQR